jgi:hypothetical protein
VISPQDLHGLALALPEAAEADHHGMSSFRVGGKIFATVPDAAHVRVMVDEGEIRALVAEDPATFQEVWWGKRLSAVLVSLERVSEAVLGELLEEAWRRKAPVGLVRARDGAR